VNIQTYESWCRADLWRASNGGAPPPGGPHAALCPGRGARRAICILVLGSLGRSTFSCRTFVLPALFRIRRATRL
jgi:hypothetical protein